MGTAIAAAHSSVGIVRAGLRADCDEQVDTDLLQCACDLAVALLGALAELGHVAEDRHGAPAAGELVEVLDRGAHRDRVRVPGVVDEQAAARELELLVAHAGEVDVKLRRQLEAEHAGRRQCRKRVGRQVARGEADLDLAERRGEKRRLERLDADVVAEPHDVEVAAPDREAGRHDRGTAGRERVDQL